MFATLIPIIVFGIITSNILTIGATILNEPLPSHQIKTILNFSNIDSQIRIRTPSTADNITQTLHFKPNEIRFNLLSISTTNSTIFASKTFSLPTSILDMQYLEETDKIIAALSSQQVAVINTTANNHYIFLDLMDCSPTSMTPKNDASIIVACSKNSTATLNVINGTNSDPLKWYIQPITNIKYNKNDITNVFIDNKAHFAYISFENKSSTVFDIKKMKFIGNTIPYSFINYFTLNNNKEIAVTEMNYTSYLWEIISRVNEFNIKPILLSSHYNNKNISFITSISCYDNILICYSDNNNYLHMDIKNINDIHDNSNSLLTIKNYSFKHIFQLNGFLYLFNEKFINRYKLPSCRRTLQEETTQEQLSAAHEESGIYIIADNKELDTSSYAKTKLHTHVAPPGLIEFMDNLDDTINRWVGTENCGSLQTAFDFNVASGTYSEGIELSYFAFLYEHFAPIPESPHIFNIWVYGNDGYLGIRPGTLLDSRIGIEAINDGSIPLTMEEITLDCPISLPPGQHYISIQGPPGGISVSYGSKQGFYSMMDRNCHGDGSWTENIPLEIMVALYGTVHTGDSITYPTELYLDESETCCIECIQSVCNAETGDIIHITNDNFCDDDKFCTKDTCTFTLGCIHINEDAACPDTCLECLPDEEGANEITGCKAKSDSDQICSDANACTIDTCDNDIGCQYEAIACDDDGIECTIESCDWVNGCVHTPNPELCDDQLQCTKDICDPEEDCIHIHQDAACPDTCLECVPGNTSNPITGCKAKANGDAICSDANACTTDICNNDIGCKYEAITCDDDGIECTIGTCDSINGCTHTPNPSLCNDDDEYTIDICDINDGCINQRFKNRESSSE